MFARGRRARRRCRRRGRRDHRRHERQALRRRCSRADDAQRGAAALARPRRPRRPRGRRPPRGAPPLRGRQARATPRSSSRGTTRSKRGSASRSARWPNGTVAGLTQLSGLHPKSAAVQLNLGIARFWAGEAGAEDAWKSAASLEPDTAYAVTAGNLLHPDFARNLPDLRPVDRGAGRTSASCPRRPSWRCSSAAPATGTVADRLFYGVALQRLGKQRSAERVFAAAAKAAPKDPEARVAAAVGLFDKARPAQAFSRLGPLSRDFPQCGHGPLSPRPPPALVGSGQGGEAPAPARPEGRARLAAGRRSRTSIWPRFAKRASEPRCWPSVTNGGIF